MVSTVSIASTVSTQPASTFNNLQATPHLVWPHCCSPQQYQQSTPYWSISRASCINMLDTPNHWTTPTLFFVGQNIRVCGLHSMVHFILAISEHPLIRSLSQLISHFPPILWNFVQSLPLFTVQESLSFINRVHNPFLFPQNYTQIHTGHWYTHKWMSRVCLTFLSSSGAESPL